MEDEEQLGSLRTQRWGRFELNLQGPSSGNPFTEITLTAKFRLRHLVIEVDGFYDGEGRYIIRFMPDTVGEWSYETTSNVQELSGIRGTFYCVDPEAGNRGPVGVDKTFHFAYADGTPFYPFGTTCYVWNHQGEELEEQTLRSLAESSAFNKIRMCVFPKHYDYNLTEPAFYPYEGSLENGWDLNSFNPGYWRHLERRLSNLQALGIEADLILFHPYDRWGFSKMSREEDSLYLRYAIARLSSFRNLWWSLANEYDLMKSKSMQDWDRYFRLLQEHDPYQHLRSIHNWHHPGIHYRSNLHWYDHGKPWVTHASIQHPDLHFVSEWREQFQKPVVIDECRYEGNLNHGWGNITAERMHDCFWEGVLQGGYVTHGETLLQEDPILWWSHGGMLHGDSPERIRFLRGIVEEGPQLDKVSINFEWDTSAGGVDGEYYLVYFGSSRPAFRILPLPEDITFTIERIDTWEMTITALPGLYTAGSRIDLPGKPYQALRITAVHN
ncbi:hypothetical protein GCM10010912_60090 [Paenibacillus albidus]|uniref:DUF5060 domain-containing protein n=1 Tax=Paenibacillus albidus TaxID=2041023 RepID=A0A917D0R1_9BACL|nr:DUF5605 domain-containing protein [Paenibacillus albidus]GGG07435.1 hypothetical protein GCM10010912_60090 [Paenibacillus albidus]